MYTQKQLKKQFEKLGLSNTGTILIHSSMKEIGLVEGGADTVLNIWIEYLQNGLLVLPTHTWATINNNNPFYYVNETPSCVGILTELFRKREGVIRSWHPTHSVAAIGQQAHEFTSGDEKFDTPCARGSTWGKLLDQQAIILLIGVDLRRNTFIHGIEEWNNIPGRLTTHHEPLVTVLPNGEKISVPSRRHDGLDWSNHFWKVEEYLLKNEVIRMGYFGNAKVRICDAVKMNRLISDLLTINPNLFSDNSPLNELF